MGPELWLEEISFRFSRTGKAMMFSVSYQCVYTDCKMLFLAGMAWFDP